MNRSPKESHIQVLMYHGLEDAAHPAGAKDPGEQLYVLSRDAFQHQMEYLAQNSFTVLLLEDLFRKKEWPEKGVVLTFDDGHQSNYTLALPILEEFAFKAHFFITTGWLNAPDFLTRHQVKKLVDHGMEVGSHGVTHSFFNDMSSPEIRSELEASKILLEQCTGKPVTSFSAPGGRVSSHVVRIGRELGYSIFCTSEYALLNRKTSPHSVPRLAVKADTDSDTFSRMVHGDPRLLRRERMKNSMLAGLKKIFGNSLYERLRAVVLKEKREKGF